MSLARVAKRRDANERYIVEALERVGAEVWILDRPPICWCGFGGGGLCSR